MKKIIFLTLLGILFTFNLSYSRDLIVAGITEEPNRWVDNNGEFRGIDVDVIDYILKKLDIKYEIVLENSSTRLQNNWQKSTPTYDMVFTYSKKAEREIYLQYANESHITFSWNFFYDIKNEGKYKYETWDDLEGLKIGVTDGFSYTKEFWDVANSGLFRKDQVVINTLQMKKLLSGRIDLVPLNTIATLYEAKTNGFLDQIGYLKKPITSKPYYNTFVKASDYPNLDKVREGYDRVLKEMKKDGSLDKILEKYGIKK